jgi:hypothetical protein
VKLKKSLKNKLSLEVRDLLANQNNDVPLLGKELKGGNK